MPGRAGADGVRAQARRPRRLRPADARAPDGAGCRSGAPDERRGRVEVREEDAFDVAAVARWLREHADGVPDGAPEVRQFPGGASNLTYLLRYPGRELILRRPPVGREGQGAHDMGREFTVQSRLAPVFGYVPEMVAFCDDPDVIGSDFYVMSPARGHDPAPRPARGLDAGRARRACAAASSTCSSSCTPSTSPAAGLADLGRGAGYVARQVAGWSERYRGARTENVADFETGDGLARRATARGRGHLRDPQRLPARQRRCSTPR